MPTALLGASGSGTMCVSHSQTSGHACGSRQRVVQGFPLQKGNEARAEGRAAAVLLLRPSWHTENGRGRPRLCREFSLLPRAPALVPMTARWFAFWGTS